MKTWTAWVTKTERYQVHVQADNWGDAREAALGAKAEGPVAIMFHAENFVQEGEPWAYSDGWYDLHGPGDVIVVNRSPGNIFTEYDVTMLATRLNAMGLVVREWWNGAGCGTVSFACDGRVNNAKFSPQELKALCAPRERL